MRAVSLRPLPFAFIAQPHEKARIRNWEIPLFSAPENSANPYTKFTAFALMGRIFIRHNLDSRYANDGEGRAKQRETDCKGGRARAVQFIPRTTAPSNA